MKSTPASAASRELRVFDIVEESWSAELFQKVRPQAGAQPDLAGPIEQESLRQTWLEGKAVFVSSAGQGLRYLLEGVDLEHMAGMPAEVLG